MSAGDAAPFVFIVTGEPSGDAIGGALIAALRARTGGRVRRRAPAGAGGTSGLATRATRPAAVTRKP